MTRAEEIARRICTDWDALEAWMQSRILGIAEAVAQEERERVKVWLDGLLDSVRRSGNVDPRSLELARNHFVREFIDAARIREARSKDV